MNNALSRWWQRHVVQPRVQRQFMGWRTEWERIEALRKMPEQTLPPWPKNPRSSTFLHELVHAQSARLRLAAHTLRSFQPHLPEPEYFSVKAVIQSLEEGEYK
jgi:hypothetical protein